MAVEYKIYIVNEQPKQKFWLFLDAPEEVKSNSSVYANSSSYMTVDQDYVGTNSFTIPIQYVIGASCSNRAVGLDVQISSVNTQETDLNQSWDIQYAEPTEKQGPIVSKGKKSKDDLITLNTLTFNQKEEAAAAWYANLSFGIETHNGYIGMTWSPIAGSERNISPEIGFYVTTGSYESNKLARWTDFSNTSAAVTKKDFSPSREATVTRKSDGTWEVKKGAPPKQDDLLSSLLISHQILCEAHVKLVNALSESGSNVASALLAASAPNAAGTQK